MSTQTIPIKEDSKVASEARESNRLSLRELEVLQCAADGEDCKGTAELLRLHTRTVKSYRHSAILKMGAENSTHAVAQALRRGIIT